MNRPRLGLSGVLLLLGAVIAGSALASGGVAPKTIVFSAKYAGKANVQVTGEVADISATGSGTGTPIGAGSITGKGTGTAAQQTCNSWSGTGLLKGTKGTLSFKMLPGTQACGGEDATLFSLVGRAVVIKGTGKLLKAKGSLKVTGTYDRSEGTFSVKFAGKLKQ